MDGTILGQGSFSSIYAGTNPNPGNAEVQAAQSQIIQVPCGVDWITVRNYTKFGTAGINDAYFNGNNNAFAGVEYYWQRGMAQGTGIVKYYGNGGQVISADTMVSGGFYLFDSITNQYATPIATTNVSNATSPIVLTANTAGLVAGVTVVKVVPNAVNANAAADIMGIDFVIGAIVANTSFTLTVAGQNALATAPGVGGAFAGTYSVQNFNPLYYPRKRYITNIVASLNNPVNATVSVNVPAQYVAGQLIRFSVPARAGMIQLDGLAGTVVSVAASGLNFDVNIDVSSFTAFTWPTSAQMPTQLPFVNPVGEDTASALVSLQPQTPLYNNSTSNQINATQTGILSDATVNTGFLGVMLGGGGNATVLGTPVSGPAGTVHFTAADVIDIADKVYWIAGKSTFGGL